MKMSKLKLRQIIREELSDVLQERLYEHRKLSPYDKKRRRKASLDKADAKRKKKERIFPGLDNLRKLSKGIVEETDATSSPPGGPRAIPAIGGQQDMSFKKAFKNTDLDSLVQIVSDFLQNMENSFSVDCTYGDVRDVMKDHPKEGLDEKKGKKKNCTPGNPYKDKRGRFVNPDDEGGSWSIGNKSKKKDCKKGKARRPRGKKELFAKLPCGRLDVDSAKVKAKYKCKDGELSS